MRTEKIRGETSSLIRAEYLTIISFLVDSEGLQAVFRHLHF